MSTSIAIVTNNATASELAIINEVNASLSPFAARAAIIVVGALLCLLIGGGLLAHRIERRRIERAARNNTFQMVVTAFRA